LIMRTIEIFSAGCSCCEDAIKSVKGASGKGDRVEVRDMKDVQVAAQAKKHGIRRVPAVVIDGKLADCCASGGMDIDTLKGLGLGSP